MPKDLKQMPNILAESSHANIEPVDSQLLLEKINSFVKQTQGYFALTMTPTNIEVRYSHPNGINIAICDSLFAPSDAAADVATRAQALWNRLLEHEKDAVVSSGSKLN